MSDDGSRPPSIPLDRLQKRLHELLGAYVDGWRPQQQLQQPRQQGDAKARTAWADLCRLNARATREGWTGYLVVGSSMSPYFGAAVARAASELLAAPDAEGESLDLLHSLLRAAARLSVYHTPEVQQQHHRLFTYLHESGGLVSLAGLFCRGAAAAPAGRWALLATEALRVVSGLLALPGVLTALRKDLLAAGGTLWSDYLRGILDALQAGTEEEAYRRLRDDRALVALSWLVRAVSLPPGRTEHRLLRHKEAARATLANLGEEGRFWPLLARRVSPRVAGWRTAYSVLTQAIQTFGEGAGPLPGPTVLRECYRAAMRCLLWFLRTNRSQRGNLRVYYQFLAVAVHRPLFASSFLQCTFPLVDLLAVEGEAKLDAGVGAIGSPAEGKAAHDSYDTAVAAAAATAEGVEVPAFALLWALRRMADAEPETTIAELEMAARHATLHYPEYATATALFAYLPVDLVARAPHYVREPTAHLLHAERALQDLLAAPPAAAALARQPDRLADRLAALRRMADTLREPWRGLSAEERASLDGWLAQTGLLLLALRSDSGDSTTSRPLPAKRQQAAPDIDAFFDRTDPTLLRNTCGNPDCPRRDESAGRAFPRCSQCKAIRYCGVECQKQDRPRHRPFCRQKAAAAATGAGAGAGAGP